MNVIQLDNLFSWATPPQPKKPPQEISLAPEEFREISKEPPFPSEEQYDQIKKQFELVKETKEKDWMTGESLDYSINDAMREVRKILSEKPPVLPISPEKAPLIQP